MFIILYAFLALRCSVCSTAIRSDSPHDPDADELHLSISADGAFVEMHSQQSRHNETDAVPKNYAAYEATFAGTMGVSRGVQPTFCVTRLINSLAEEEGAYDALSAIIEEEEEDERDLAEQAEQERKLAEQERKRKLAERQRKLAELIAYALLRKGACVGEVKEYYDFVEVVGQGQFGTVYSAKRRGDGMVVAVKEIHSNLAHFNPLEVEPPRLHLPHNSEILEVYVTQDLDKKARSPPPSISLVYVYYPKTDLKAFLTDHLRKQFDDETLALGASDIHVFARQIAFGLLLLHQQGFLHRDLKPENILVVLEPGAEDYEITRHKLVITDYGTVVDGCSEGNPKCASGQTGTPYYMAKAQFEGKERYGPEVDWHAFGVILYQLALGLDAHPFQTKTESDAKCVQNICEQQPNLDPIREKSKYFYDLLSLLLSERVNQIPPRMWWQGAKRHPVWSHAYWILEPNTQATRYRDHVEFWKAVCAQSLSRGLDGGAVERCTKIGDPAAWEPVTLCQH